MPLPLTPGENYAGDRSAMLRTAADALGLDVDDDFSVATIAAHKVYFASGQTWIASTVGEVLDKTMTELDGKGGGLKIVQQGAIRVVLNKPGPASGKTKQKRNAANPFPKV
eukprot:jgi/Ulvmu1/10456/UM063_0011.1